MLVNGIKLVTEESNDGYESAIYEMFTVSTVVGSINDILKSLDNEGVLAHRFRLLSIFTDTQGGSLRYKLMYRNRNGEYSPVEPNKIYRIVETIGANDTRHITECEESWLEANTTTLESRYSHLNNYMHYNQNMFCSDDLVDYIHEERKHCGIICFVNMNLTYIGVERLQLVKISKVFQSLLALGFIEVIPSPLHHLDEIKDYRDIGCVRFEYYNAQGDKTLIKPGGYILSVHSGANKFIDCKEIGYIDSGNIVYEQMINSTDASMTQAPMLAKQDPINLFEYMIQEYPIES